MTKEQLQGLADWLADLDSHSIYAENLLHDLAQFGITSFHNIGEGETRLTLDGGKTSVDAGVQTAGQVRREMDDRGLGGHLAEDAGSSISGFRLAEALCELLDLGKPGAMYMGRGRRFRSCVDAIRQAGAK